MRDRLIELIQEASAEAGKHFRETTKKVLAEKGRFNSKEDIDRRNIYEIEADYLLANGVIVPPCKVGDYVEWDNGISLHLYPVKGFVFDTNAILDFRIDLGFFQPIVGHRAIKRILTREEAEAKLKEGGKE